MKIETNLCMGCMQEKDYQGECRECGYDDSDRQTYLVSYLAPKTLLRGKYIIGKLISYNGEGAIYLAYDNEKKTRVTIKEYMPDTLCERSRGEENIRVKSDCAVLYKTYLAEFAELNNNLMKSEPTLNLQTVLDVFTENNTAYAVFEYIIGTSLKSFLTNLGGVLPWDQVQDLFKPILSTLGVIHSHGIIHRGINPSTIFFNNRQELKLIGFGITASRTYGSELNFEVFPGYSAPEQYNISSRHGSFTDVYGICAVLYKALTGRIPENALTRAESDTLAEPIMLNRDVPANVSKAIMGGLSLSPDTRIKTIEELIEKLFKAPKNTSIHDVTDVITPVKPQSNKNGELLVKPPVKKKPNTAHNTSLQRDRRKKQSNLPQIILISFIGLLVLVFIIVIAMLMNTDEPESEITESTTDTMTATTTTEFIFTTTPKSQTEVTTTTYGGPLYILPDFRGRGFEVIVNSNNYNFLTFTAEYEFSDEYDEGYIFEQSIEPETEVPSGTELVVKVSKGPEFVELPSYSDMTISAYKSLLSSLKIKYETFPEDSFTVEKDKVIRSNFEIGEKINVGAGDVVEVYYSTGEFPVIEENEE